MKAARRREKIDIRFGVESRRGGELEGPRKRFAVVKSSPLFPTHFKCACRRRVISCAV
jgi:hypothetical protein